MTDSSLTSRLRGFAEGTWIAVENQVYEKILKKITILFNQLRSWCFKSLRLSVSKVFFLLLIKNISNTI